MRTIIAADVDLALYAEGMDLIRRSGVLQFLSAHGAIREVAAPDNFEVRHVAEAHRALGYKAALYELAMFREVFLQERKIDRPPMDYGGVKLLADKGIITEKEADDLRKNFNDLSRQ